MNNIKYIFGFLILLTSLQTYSAECESVSLQFEGSRTQLDQGNIGWCVSYSLADIVSQKLGEAVSPIDIAIKMTEVAKKNYAKNEFEGASESNIKSFFEVTDEFCNELDYTNHDSAKEEFQALIDSYKSFTEINRLKTQLPSSYVAAKESLATGKKLSFFKNLNSSDYLTISESAKDANQYIKELNVKNCKNKLKSDAPLQLVYKDLSSGWDQLEQHETNLKYIKEIVSQRKMMSITIDTSQLFTTKKSFLELIFGAHAVTVVGQSSIKNKCYFAIRDSAFGEEKACSEMKKDGVSCASNQTYWVEESLLAKAVKNSYWLK